MEHYQTSDLALSAFLNLYFPIDSLDKTYPNKTIFLFKRSKELESLIEAYWKRKVQVNPQDYFSAIKNVKSRLYQE
ncbi:MAG TPA: DUF5659 domain-containing protein [Patescibacteria group bacterium]|nr:DUF5659 domain-containing protein [Patescibacteria group bacterium]